MRETKCYTPMVQSAAGTGSMGGIAMVGHKIAMGNVEEKINCDMLGRAARGVPGERFNHTTGAGHVEAVPGAVGRSTGAEAAYGSTRTGGYR